MRTEIPSRTARKAALNIVTLGAKRGMKEVLPQGIVDATMKLLVESGAVSQSVVRFACSRVAAGFYLAFDWMMPGQLEAFAHRKVFCEQQVKKCIAAGARQVLVLGAGYDTLCWRLAPEFANVNFFEIDHPATARLKANGIKKMGSPANLYLIAEDLGERHLVDILHTNSIWDLTVPTVIVVEALLMYLPPEAVETLFEQCAAVSGSDSRVAFTFIGTRANGQPDAGPWTWLVLWLLKVSGEPLLWSIQPEEVGPFLKKTTWTIVNDEMDSLDRCGIEFFGVVTK